jgi:hypothetical protein
VSGIEPGLPVPLPATQLALVSGVVLELEMHAPAAPLERLASSPEASCVLMVFSAPLPPPVSRASVAVALELPPAVKVLLLGEQPLLQGAIPIDWADAIAGTAKQNPAPTATQRTARQSGSRDDM